MPVTWRAYIDSRTVQMEQEIRELRRKGFINEVTLKTAEERCDSLEKHVRFVHISHTLTAKSSQIDQNMFSRDLITLLQGANTSTYAQTWVARQRNSITTEPLYGPF